MNAAIGIISLDFSRWRPFWEGLQMVKSPKWRHLPRYLVRQLDDRLLEQNHGVKLKERM